MTAFPVFSNSSLIHISFPFSIYFLAMEKAFSTHVQWHEKTHKHRDRKKDDSL